MPEPIVYIEHAVDVLGHAVRLARAGRRFTLVTSIEIRGGSAREVGSLAVVDESGVMWGYLSNGCIDRDIQLQAQAALVRGSPKILHYGAGSPFLDLKLPCGGSLKLLLDPSPDRGALEAAHAALLARRPARLSVTLPPDGSGDAAETVFTHAPKPRLVVAGRGAVFRATVQIAHGAGFDLAVLSPEGTDLDAIGALSSSAPVALRTPDSPVGMDLDSQSAFLTLFHDHDWEPALLLAALRTPARFIGCLGSTKTHAQRLATLRGMGVSDADLARVSGPLGLVPSLRHAPSIGVSAMAQVIAAFPRAVEMSEKRGLSEPADPA